MAVARRLSGGGRGGCVVPMRERELQRLCRGVDGVGSEKICKQLRSMCVMRPSTEFDLFSNSISIPWVTIILITIITLFR